MWYNKYQKKILYVLMIEGEVAYVMKIAIIDSGVDQSFFQEGWRVIEYVICDGKFIQSKRIKCSNQHGTNVVNILSSKLSNKNIELVSIKILDDANKGKMVDLYKAILFCITKNIKYINISLGYSGEEKNRMDRLQKIFESAYENECYVVAASSNSFGQESYPAKFKNVIGIFTGEEHGINVNVMDKNIEMNGYLVADIKNKKFLRGNSYISPIFLSYLILCKEKNNYGINAYMENLKANCSINKNNFFIYRDSGIEHFFIEKKIYFFGDLKISDDVVTLEFFRSIGKYVVVLDEEDIHNINREIYISQLYIGYTSDGIIDSLKRLIINHKELKRVVTIFPVFQIWEFNYIYSRGVRYISYSI